MPQTPNQRRASDAVAAWLAKHHKNPAWLVDEAKADPGTISDFLAHERWPKIGTQGRLEDALGWPAGTIRQIGNGTDLDIDQLIATAPGAAVGGSAQDAGYVASPGEKTDGGASNDDVLEGIREMRDDLRALRQAIERLADTREPGA